MRLPDQYLENKNFDLLRITVHKMKSSVQVLGSHDLARLLQEIEVSSKELDSVPQVISDLGANSSIYKERITELRDRNIFAFGRSSEIGAQRIMDIISNESD